MSATTARIQRRLRNGARSGNLDTTNPDTLRLVLSAALFDGERVPDWRRAAACRDVDPETFYPPQGWAGTLLTATAVRICTECPVRAACLADVMAWERPSERHGVVGGLTGPERSELAQRLDAQSTGTAAGGVSA